MRYALFLILSCVFCHMDAQIDMKLSRIYQNSEQELILNYELTNQSDSNYILINDLTFENEKLYSGEAYK